VNVVWGVVVLVVAAAAAIGGMLLCRRRAPDGGYFADGDRAAGVFGVLATGFSVLLGFLIFLSFESFDASRSGAEDEAMTVVQQVETAQLLPPADGAELTGALVCYGRWVVFEEWPAMEDGTLGDALNPWAVELFVTTERIEPESASEQAAFGKWLDQTTDRETARQDRIHGAAGVMPTPLWIALFFISAIVVVYLLAFADSGERAAVQALYAGSVVSVIVAMLLLLAFLDDPVSGGVGGLEPTAMERALVLIDEGIDASGTDVVLPCDESGRP
jgi:amino acid transporter